MKLAGWHYTLVLSGWIESEDRGTWWHKPVVLLAGHFGGF